MLYNFISLIKKNCKIILVTISIILIIAMQVYNSYSYYLFQKEYTSNSEQIKKEIKIIKSNIFSISFDTSEISNINDVSNKVDDLQWLVDDLQNSVDDIKQYFNIW